MGEMTLGGKFLVASPLMGDPNFARTVVLMLQHDEDGALGVVVNRPSESPVAEHLPEWAPHSATPPVVFVGGPVSPETGIGLRKSEPGGVPAVEVFDLVADREVLGPIRVFSGYAGWGPNQLEAELEDTAWLVVEASGDAVFTDRPDLLWGRIMRSVDPEFGVLATLPDDPSLN